MPNNLNGAGNRAERSAGDIRASQLKAEKEDLKATGRSGVTLDDVKSRRWE